jgi:hypothetical protein
MFARYDSTIVNPNRIRIRAIQVTLRIWDPKAELVRQMCVVQDL